MCDTAKMLCVECTSGDIGSCGGTTPVCSIDQECTACAAHSDCASNACLPDGSCGTDADVAYVDPAVVGGSSCTRAMPCTQIAMALATNRPFIKLRGTIDEPVSLTNRNVTFLAEPGAVLKNSNGNGLNIAGSSRVEIYDLTISQSTTGIQVPPNTTASLFLARAKVQNNANGGIVMESGMLRVTLTTIANNTGAGGIFSPGATVSVSASTFANNSGGAGIIVTSGSLTVSRTTFLNNINGGIALSPGGTFAIVSNVFFNNGQSNASTGGVSIDTAANAGNRLELNTFVQNKSNTTTGPAIHCTAGTFTARSNIMSGNTGGTAQYGGTCTHAYSISRPGSVPTGTGNVASDPLFVDAAAGNVHLLMASPARGAGDPATDLSNVALYDIDDDMRAIPPDIGADQFKP